MATIQANTTATQTTANTTALPVMVGFKPWVNTLELADTDKVRHIVLQYRAKAGEPAKHASSYLEAPNWITAELVEANLSRLMPHIIGFFQSVEDAQVKALHMAGIQRLGEVNFNLEALLKPLEAMAAERNRLSAESIKTLFNESIEAALLLALIEKGLNPEIPAMLVKIQAVSAATLTKLQSLASPKTSLPKPEAEALLRLLSKVEAPENVTLRKVTDRLEAMLKTDTDLLADLF